MRMDNNNNKTIVIRFADRNLENNRARNFFTGLTIVLSAALVLTFILYIFGSSREKLRMQEDTPQVSYMDITPQQFEKLSRDSRILWIGAEKTVGSAKVEADRISVLYEDANYIKKDKLQYTGELPEEENEIMVPRDYLQKLGITAQPGETLSMDLGDKIVRDYKLSAIVESPSKAKNNHKIYVSLLCAIMMRGEEEVRLDAIVNMKNAMDMSFDFAQERALEIGSLAGIAAGQTKINDGYFSQASVSRLNFVSILTLILSAVLILAAAGIVIHNIFYISVAGKVREYGQMRTIGMTRKQVRKVISREGYILALRSIPFGLLIGGILGYALAPKGFDFQTFIGAALVCFLLGLVSVSISVRKPGKIAAMKSPIEALGYTGYQKMKGQSDKLKRVLTPENLAAINLKRNKKKSFLTMCSLVLAGVLLGTIASFIVSYDSTGSVKYSFPNGEYQLQLMAGSGFTGGDVSLEGRSKLYAQLQAEDRMGGLEAELTSIGGVSNVSPWRYLMICSNMFGKEKEEGINGISKEDFELLKDMHYEGPDTYEELLAEPGFIVETENNSNFIDFPLRIGDQVPVVYFTAGGERIETSIPVKALVHQITWSQEKKAAGENVVLPLSIMGSTLMMPGEVMDKISGMSTVYGYEIAVEPGQEENVGKVLEELYGAEENLFLTSKKDMIASLKDMFFSVQVILYVLTAFLVVFGVSNLMNTIMTNLYSRKKELGILQAIGMTSDQVRRMLSRETLSYVGISILCTILLGGAMGYLLVRAMYQAGMEMNYTFPWIPVWIYAVVLGTMQWGMTRYGVWMLQKESMVSRMGKAQ